MDPVQYKNRAVAKLRYLKDGTQETITKPKLSVETVAAQSAIRSGDARGLADPVKKDELKRQRKNMMISAGAALGIIILFVLAVKYKFIKL